MISGNANNGIELAASGQADSTKTLIQGNIIGLIASGLNILGNGNHGIFQNGADNTTIGGTATGARNVISGNGNDGISMGTGIDSLVEGNFIGTDITGAKALGNRIGLEWTNASSATIGGTAVGAGNVISGNTSAGINSFVLGSGNEVIQGNLIGVDVSGKKALPNQGVGMRISGPTNNTIGGTAMGAGNVIAGNHGDGIEFTVGPADGTVVEGNFIGTDTSGTLNLGNQGAGVVVSSNNVTIGGTANGAGNIIANNTRDGINLGGTDQDSFLSNSIYNNGGLGINFGNGPTPNHAWPPGVTSGPNLFQNYPVLGTATSSAGNTTIAGTLNAVPNTQFLVQFFASPTADPSGYGQGQIYLGSTTVMTDGTSNAAFNATLSGVSIPGGYAVTATATDPLGNTSEFAKDVITQNVADLGINGQISESPAYVGDTVTYTFTISNAGPDTGHGVTFTDTLPAGVNYADGFSSVPAGMTPIVSGNSITVNVGTLAAGATVTLMFQAQITTGAASSITNTGSVTTTDFDPTTPDTADVTTTILPSADLAITQLSTTPAPNYAGQT